MTKAAIALFLLVFTALSAHGAEGMKTAIDIVEDFSRESNRLMEGRSISPPASAAAMDNAVEELKQIRLTEPPGAARSKRVYALVDSFTAFVLDSVGRSGGKPGDIAHVTGRLEGIRAEMLKKLKTTLDAESIEKRRPRPVPSLDLSPYDEPPTPDDEKGGILFR